ncbi:MAG: cytochrome-c peroxidase [Planctomycetota bacterium]|jgi:cytochrome c peroxidase
MRRRNLGSTGLCVFVALFGMLTSGSRCALDDTPAVHPLQPSDTMAKVDAALHYRIRHAGVTPLERPPRDAPELVELGRNLFFDRMLSGNHNISCATCHIPELAFTDGLPVSFGEGAEGAGRQRTGLAIQLIARNAPGITNRGVKGFDSMLWDSRAAFDPKTREITLPVGLLASEEEIADVTAPIRSALALQALLPVVSAAEMRGDEDDEERDRRNELAEGSRTDDARVWRLLIKQLLELRGYRRLFRAAFPNEALEDLTFGHAAEALAAFQREVGTFTDTPFDRYLGGDFGAITKTQKEGAALFFGKADCARCHRGPHLSDFEHHALAVPQIGPGRGLEFNDRGRALESREPLDIYKFRTPALRNVEVTGPYMHDGAYASLREAIRHHVEPAACLEGYDPSELPPDFSFTAQWFIEQNEDRLLALSPRLPSPKLTEEELDLLVEFLASLTDPRIHDVKGIRPKRVASGLKVEAPPRPPRSRSRR